MSASVAELAVTEDEWLARFVLRKDHVRSDGTVKPDPFIPYRLFELSVTRHLGLAEGEIWRIGETVASQIGTSLQGRADAKASVFIRQRLRIVAAPEQENPNHANVIDWPRDKQAQKEIALELVKQVRFKARPTSSV